MSELTTALERISTWYWEKQTRSVFQPGLFRTATDLLVKDLTFLVPGEIHELYEWCNGSSEDSDPIVFHQMYLLPLEEAVRLRQDRSGLSYGDDIWQDDPSWFPVFKLWCGHAFYVVVLGDKNKSIVRNYDPELQNYSVRYESLTNLLLHSAEWLESVYYNEDHEFCSVGIKIETELKVKYQVSESIHPEDLRWADQ